MFERISPHPLLVFLTIIFRASCQKASLTFAIDDTRSMGNDIAQVRNDVDAIMNIVLNEKSSQISNIVLVTFNDPAVKVRTITNSSEDLKLALSEVKPNNFYNYDCPEMALTGIKLALEKSLSGSYVYVFTDASAKDFRMSEEIQQLCQKKQSQIVFVLTGDCHRPTGRRFRVYYDIAAACTGLALRVEKSDVKEVLRTIEETIKGNKTVLTSIVTPPGIYTDVPFEIDDQTEYATVSTSGTDVSLQITGPLVQIDKILWTRHGKVVKLINPPPGKYVATVEGRSATSVVIVGRSDFLFRHGFSELKPKSVDDTTPQPFSDTLTHLSILVTDPKHSVRIQEVQILDMKENEINKLPLTELTPDFYTTEQFIAPNEMFKVAVKGENTQTGKPYRRIAKIPVTPQKPPLDKPVVKKPVVQIKEGKSIGVAAGRAVTLTCEVAAYPKPEITWRNIHGITVPSKSSTKQIPYDYISYLEVPEVSEKVRYYCHATNIAGKDYKAIDVIIKDPFIIGTIPKGTTKVQYGTESTVNCDIKSQEPLNIRWYRVDKLTGKTAQISSSDQYSISADNTQLKIKSMDEDLEGKYTCKAYLIKDPTQNREFSTNVEIQGLVPPKINPSIEIINVQEHMPAVIKCKILEGAPHPKISWQFKASGSASRGYQPVAGSGAELHLSSAELDHAGFYKCVAYNSKGRDEQTVAELVVLKKPAVTIEGGEAATVQYGRPLMLKCKIFAYPEPTVTWTDDRGNTLPGSFSQSKNNYEYTYTLNNVKQSRKYTCRAENNQGSKTESILVTVPSPFSVHSQPPNTLTVNYGSSLNLKCDIKSHMPMKINWYYASTPTSGGRQLSSSDKYLISVDETELRIKSMDVDLPGAYTCKAVLINDPLESKSFTTNIHIGGLVPPEINPTLENKEIKEGSPTIITCKILKGVPKPKVSWLMKSPVSKGYRAIAGSGPQLHIAQTELTDAGQYKCVAENTAGRREQVVANLTVLKAPAVSIAEGASVSVAYGGRLTLTCRVTASPEPAVTWKDNAGNTIPALSSAKSKFDYSYVITHDSLKTSGKYYCSAKNSQGSASEGIKVSVLSPFNVHSTPPDISIAKYGTEVTLHCNITSKLPMQIFWYHTKDSTNEKKQIKSSKQYSILTNGAELKIKSMDVGLDGKYSCKASLLENDDHIEYTTKLKIGGLEAPEVTGDVDKKAKVGTQVSISCSVVKGVPKPTVSWQFSAAGGDKFEAVANSGSVLRIDKARRADTGRYKCIARNSEGAAVHVTVLTVEESARIVSDEFKEYKCVEGDIALRIPCEAVGNPKPIIEWKVEDSLINPGKKYAIEEGALVIKNPKQSDSKSYTCTATNYLGSNTKTFKGSVHAPPEIDPKSVSIKAKENTSATISCKVIKGLPKPKISWQKKMPESKEYLAIAESGPQLHITQAALTDAGKYKCIAENIVGRREQVVAELAVLKAPAVSIAEGAGVSVAYGGELTLTCRVTASPEPVVTWKDNAGSTILALSSPSISKFEYSYIITHHSLKASGKYYCSANNNQGSASQGIQVTVLSPFKVHSTPPDSSIADYGTEVTLHCNITSKLPMQILWYHIKDSTNEKKQIKSSKQHFILSNGAELKINSMDIGLDGKYSCKASLLGNDEHVEYTTKLKIGGLETPEVTGDIDKKAKVGTKVSISCSVVKGVPKPAVSWQFQAAGGDKFEAVAHSGSVLRIDEARRADAGRYKCTARNSEGAAEHVTVLTVEEPARIISDEFKEYKCLEGNTALRIPCDAVGNPKPTIEWKVEGSLITPDKKYAIEDGTLVIKNPTQSDSKSYTCTAKNYLGSNTKTFKGSVHTPPEIDPISHSIKTQENTPATISCKILKGLPKPQISWEMKAPGSTGYLAIEESGPQLHIAQAALTDAGQYKCIAENIVGRREQVVAELAVLKAPAVSIAEGASVSVAYGGRLTLTCRVTASPEPAITWKDNAGNTIPAAISRANSTFEYSYIITRDNLKASSHYSCSANNGQGSETKSIQVSVSSPFTVHSHLPDSIIGKYGTDVSLHCNITSTLPMQILWYHTKKGGSEKKQILASQQYSILSNGAELQIKSMDIGLDGEYCCKASLLEDDEHAEFTSKVEIAGLESPVVTGSKNIKGILDKSVSINCSVVKGVPKPAVSWQFQAAGGDKFEAVAHSGSVLRIDEARRADAGRYKCTARNSEGAAEHVTLLTIDEPARILTDEFTEYEGLVGDIALRIPCDAVGNPKPTIEWRVQGSVITAGPKYAIEEGALIIKNPTESDSKSYTCTATNYLASNTKTFNGSVNEALMNYGTRHKIFIRKHQQLNLPCNLSRSDAASIKWFKEGVDWHDNNPYIYVEKATAMNDGNYTCHVSDAHGSATETYEVDVGYPPSFKFPQDSPFVDWNGDPEDVLDCKVDAKPEAEIQWTYDDKPLPNLDTSELLISKLGNYTCKASNVHGVVQRDFIVVPRESEYEDYYP